VHERSHGFDAAAPLRRLCGEEFVDRGETQGHIAMLAVDLARAMRPHRERWGLMAVLGRHDTAERTSSVIRCSTPGVQLRTAKPMGHSSPSSRFARSSKPMVA
jgi:hypothetical protein